MCRGLEARQALEAGEAATAPAFARPRAPRQGPPPATPHSPSARPAPAPGRRVARRPPRALLAPGTPPPPPCPLFLGGSFLPRSRRLPLHPPPLPAAGAGRRGPSRVRRVSAAGPQPFPAAATALSGAAKRGAARDWRAAVAAGGVEGREGRRGERAARGYTAALRPTREEQPRAGARRERAGGRPRGEGSRGRRNGCHVARWFSAPAPGPRPLPLGPAGLLQGAPTHAAGARPETRAHPCWPLARSLKRSEFRAWREAQPGPWGPEGRLSRKLAALPSPPRVPAEGGRGSLGRRKALG